MNKNSMKIGIVANNYISGSIGGAEIYFTSLLSGLDEVDHLNQYYVFIKESQKKYLPKLSSKMNIIGLSDAPLSKVRRKIISTFTSTDYLSKIINAQDLDVVHFPFQVISTRNICAPLVSTFLDIQEEYYPEYFNNKDLLARKKIHRHSADISDEIIAISRFTKQSLINKYGVNADKISVIYLSYNNSLFGLNAPLSRINLPERYLFYPAASWPHKNHLLLIDAFHNYLMTNPKSDLSLVLSGINKQNHVQIIEKISKLELSDRINMMGYVETKELVTIYRKATALVFPSLFEGFGIPVVEAMASGCPVICSNRTSLPEIAGNAAIYFDPSDKNEIASAINKICSQSDLRSELIKKGNLQIKKFSNLKMARATLKIYRAAAKNEKE